ncbi:MAG: futalosine hydrolase [Sphingobacterium sp.]
MKFLVVAATELEIQPSIPKLQAHKIDYLITGVGMVATAFSMAQYLGDRSYDFLLNVGIAGTFNPEHTLGDLYRVSNDTIYGLGAQDDQQFLPIETLGFGQSVFAEHPPKFSLGPLLENLPCLDGITVNTVHGNEQSIKHLLTEIDVNHLESMEGAAFFYAAQKLGIPSIQVRAISNLVEKRNTQNWAIPKAINQLNHFLDSLINSTI